MSEESDLKRYHEACHAMQTGVAYHIEHDPTSAEPKHLRVGVNSAMSSHGALVKLLIDKGIFTRAEYINEIANFMEAEVINYESVLANIFEREVVLK